ncbi:hypothetical protein CLV36_10795 [Laceyella sediminis]|uniref:Uncharacterized protein n=2 Tax=Laceyella TaxID=292635 RepID=A0AA46ACV7_9BACL|nr:hypothetical protein CLV36_10795 [Laceyella sediminis]SMP00853.1 hypothetical protein SAMN06265361_101169 [Laceyella tengchongensis]
MQLVAKRARRAQISVFGKNMDADALPRIPHQRPRNITHKSLFLTVIKRKTPAGAREFCYNFKLELWPGCSLASGSKYCLALFTAVGASPKPTAINFTLPG